MTNSYNSRRERSPFKRWRDLSVAIKLRVSVIAVLLLAFGLAIVAFRAALVEASSQNLGVSQQQRLKVANTTLGHFLDTSYLNVSAAYSNSYTALQYYIDALNTPGTEADRPKLLGDLGQTLLTYMSNSPTEYDIRFINVKGERLVDTTRTTSGHTISVVRSDNPTSDLDKSYFPLILQQKPDQVYLAGLDSAGHDPALSNPTVVHVIFQFGVPVYYQGRAAGALIVGIVADDALVNLLGAEEAVSGGSNINLLDPKKHIVAGFDASGKRYIYDGTVHTLSNTLPDSLFGSTVISAQRVGLNTVSIQPVSVAAIGGTQTWYIVAVDGSELAAQPPLAAQNAVLPILLIVAGVTLAVYLIARSVTDPLRDMASSARRIAGGDLDYEVPVRSQDEIGQMGQALNSMVRQTSVLINTLEQRVVARTRDIEIASEISRDAVSSRDVNDLLQKTVQAILERFDFYHVQVFLLDDNNEYAVLVTSTGEAGRQLLERKHRLAVGSQSIIGQVTSKGEAFLTLDTQSSTVPHRFNPLLPDTRSEMALPMRANNRLIGALDVQSIKQNAFDENNIQVFQVLADQLAISIDNARLIEQSTRNVRQVDDLNRQLTRQAWQNYTQDTGNTALAFNYDMLNVQPGESTTSGVASESTDKTLISAPITLRGETIGNLSALSQAGTPLSDDDRALVQAVADRVALAVENARLGERTQTAFAEIERLYAASRALGAAVDLDAVYVVAADQISKFNMVDRLYILRNEPRSAPVAQWMSYGLVWSRLPLPSEEHPASGTRVPPQVEGLVRGAGATETYVMNDVETLRPNEMAYAAMKSIGVESALIAPLKAGNRNFGVLLLQSKTHNALSPGFVQFANSVADQVSIAIENRQLFEETQAESRRNRALAEAVEQSSQIGVDLREGVQSLLEKVAVPANYDRWWFGTLSADGQTLSRVVSRFDLDTLVKTLRMVSVAEDSTAIGEAVRLNTPVVVNERDHYTLSGLPEALISAYGKHLAIPIAGNDVGAVTGVLLIGRSFESADLDERDFQLVTTLGNQIAVAVENRRLFNETQTGRQTLQSVLNSLPVGVVVIDAQTRQVTLSNAQTEALLAFSSGGRFSIREIAADETVAVESEDYRSDSFPPYRVLETGEAVENEELTVTHTDGNEYSILVNAAPIHDTDGTLLSTVAVFTDVSDLRDLEKELQKNLNETTLLYASSRAIAGQSALAGIAEVVLKPISSTLHPDMLFAIFQDEQFVITDTIEAVPGIGNIEGAEGSKMTIVPWTDGLPFERSLLTETVGQVETILIRRVTPRPFIDPRFESIASLTTSPLYARNRIVGWLAIGFNTAYTPNSEEQRLITNMASQSALAAESIYLAAQTQTALREAETLYRASRAISGASSTQSAALVIRDQVLALTPDRIDVFVMAGRDAADRVKWLVRWEAHPPDARDTLLINESYITDADLLSSDPLFLEDIADASDIDLETVRLLPLSDDIQAQISVPLRTNEKYIGRLVISYFEPRPFSQSERQFIETLAEQSSVVIDNVILYQEGQESLQETTTLYQTSRAIADSTDNLGVLMAIVEQGVPLSVTRVMLIQLLASSWNDPYSSIEILADFSRSPDTMLMTGMHFTASQFPGWRELATPDIMWVDNIMEAPQLSEDSKMGYLAFDLGAFVMVPMLTGGKIIGTLLIGSDSPREHTDRELRLYTSIVNQAAIAIENRNLLRQAETRARQLSASAEVGRAATSILNLDELLNKTVELIKQSFYYDQVQIFLMSADNRTARLQASTGEAGRQLLAVGHSLPVGSSSVIGRVTESRKMYNVVDTADARQTHRPNPYLPNTRSELALPLIAKGQVVGALDVQSNQPGAFTAEDETLLGTLADQIAIAIDNATLFEERNQSIEEQRFLFNVTRTAAAVELELALSRVTRQVQTMTKAELAVMLLMDEEKQRLLVTYAAAEGARYIISPSLPLDMPIIAQLLSSREAIQIDNEAADKLFNPDDVPGLESLTLVPMLSGDEFIGVLGVASNRVQAYTPDTVRLLQTLSSTLTAIIQNARLLRELRDANARLKEVDGLKSQFLANMSHELRTPLNSIIGFSRVILKGIDGPLNDMQSQDLSTIHESGKHLLNLVNDILDQAKIEAGKMELSLEFFNVTELAKSVLSTAVGLVKDKPIRLHQEIQADLPLAYGDEFRTRQVLLNMLSNAAKFTRQGSVTLSTFVIDDGGKPMIQVSVTDTGIGISRENMRRVFAQFEQVDNSTARNAEGTGLGMPIAKSLIELQGGRIWVESEPNVGSTFSITIPTQSPELQAEEVPTPEDAAADIDTQLQQVMNEAEAPVERTHRIVVVVDDDAGMISLYRRYLVKSGYEIIGTTNPDEAADLIVNYLPRVVLLDVNMPQRNGWDVLQQLKDNDTTFQYPVIVCSIEDDKTRGYRLGAANYLVKPFLEEDLVAAIRQIELERDLPSVLLIDNQPESLRLMREALTVKEDVLRVLEATTGEQGLDMIISHRPNMVVLDLRMPGMDGFSVLERIRQNPDTATLPVLIVTAADLSSAEMERLSKEHVQLKVKLSGEELLICVKEQLALP